MRALENKHLVHQLRILIRRARGKLMMILCSDQFILIGITSIQWANKRKVIDGTVFGSVLSGSSARRTKLINCIHMMKIQFEIAGEAQRIRKGNEKSPTNFCRPYEV